jgi:cytochrome c-type biogenesis protein CcmF
MQVLGQILVFVAFAWTAVALAVSILGVLTGESRWIRAGAAGTRAAMWLNVATSLVLLQAILTHDFSNRYVASYTDSHLPLVYLFTAFWGGEKGALMFWILSLAILGAILARQRRDDGSQFFGWVNVTVLASLIFFNLLTVFASNPFETFLTSGGPPDGSGLNPLLQNPLMAVHPPLQLAGFVAYAIPFAFAMAALITGRNDGKWIAEVRPWNLFAWTMLTSGLIIGEVWSYLELGWGGYWGWDPVENAALLPWLTGTAFLHTASVEQRRGMFRRWNVVLASLTFFLTIFATFLTRSQLIASLHSFSNSVLTPYFIYYMLFLAIACTALIAWRWKRLESPRTIEHLSSREAFVLAMTILFLMAVFVVLWGTMLPKLSESPVILGSINGVLGLWNSLTGASLIGFTQAVVVGPEWFNKVVGPIGLLILALAALGPMVPLRSSPGPAARRVLAWTAGVAVLGSLLFLAAHVVSRAMDLALVTGFPFRDSVGVVLRGVTLGGYYGAIAVVLSLWLLATIAVDWTRAVRRRRQGARKANIGRTMLGLFRDNPKRFGGHLVHIGVALSFLGFAGEGAKIQKKNIILEPLERVQLGSEEIVYLGLHDRWQPNGSYSAARAEFVLHPIGKPLPAQSMKDLLAWLPADAVVEPAEPPEVRVRFPDEAAAQDFLVHATAAAKLARDFQVRDMDPASRRVRLAPARLETVRVVPDSFHRLMGQLQGLVVATGGRMRVNAARGEPLLVVETSDDRLFEALASGLSREKRPPVIAVVSDPRDPTMVRVVPRRSGPVLRPEVRFFLKSENPTTEVSIRMGLWSDLYLAMSPGQRTQSVSVSLMLNPMMLWLWAGSFFLLFFAGLLVVPWSRGEPTEAGDATVEEQKP